LNKNDFLAAVLFLISSHAASGQHTFSICAVDTVTGEVGSAGASCIEHSVIISDLHPGKGVIHTQAAYISYNQDFARMLMQAGLTPQEIIDSLVGSDFVIDASIRQYGVVGIYNGSPLTHAFTGSDCIDYKGHIIGPYYTIQGNILLGQQILDSMESGFLNTQGTLAQRLMAALQGAKVVGADTRCTSSGNSSLSSFLRVAKPTDSPDSPYINLVVDSGPIGFEPIDSLQKLFDQLSDTTDTTGTGIFPPDDFDVKIFPKPSEGKIFVAGRLADDAVIEIYNTAGRMVLSQTITSKEIITGELPRGVFLWRIVHGKPLLSGRMVWE